MKKVVLYIAFSLDGYIADDQGGVDWLGGHTENYQGDYGVGKFLTTIDTVVMGYTTYHQVATELFPGNWPYAGLTSYVLTQRPMADTDEIKFVSQSPSELVRALKQRPGQGIWICGGAKVVKQLLDTDLIDEYHLSIIPMLLGEGIRLFGEHGPRIPLKLISTSSDNGVLDCVYHKR